jgi:hypothetical protein
MASASTISEQYHKMAIRVTGDETCVSFVNVETKEQSKQWLHTHSPNKPKKFKKNVCQEADCICFLGQEMEC